MQGSLSFLSPRGPLTRLMLLYFSVIFSLSYKANQNNLIVDKFFQIKDPSKLFPQQKQICDIDDDQWFSKNIRFS